MNGVKERVGEWPAAQAVTDLLRRSVETFIHMQQEFLKIAGKQTHTWMEAAKAGKPYESEHVVELAREAMENFVKAQKHFMDVIAEETAKATGGKHTNGAKKMKKTELSQLARQATESFIDAQRKLVDVAGRQMNANVKTAGKTLELLRPFPFLPLAELTREGVKSYVDAQKELMDVMVKPNGAHKRAHKTEHRAKRRRRKRLRQLPDRERRRAVILSGVWPARGRGPYGVEGPRTAERFRPREGVLRTSLPSRV